MLVLFIIIVVIFCNFSVKKELLLLLNNHSSTFPRIKMSRLSDSSSKYYLFYTYISLGIIIITEVGQIFKHAGSNVESRISGKGFFALSVVFNVFSSLTSFRRNFQDFALAANTSFIRKTRLKTCVALLRTS